MPGRYLAIWFRYLATDVLLRRQPNWHQKPLVWVEQQRGSYRIRALSADAERLGIYVNQSVAEARALVPSLIEADTLPETIEQILHHLGLWLIRFSPDVYLHPPDTILLNSQGCDHLWGGEACYLTVIHTRLQQLGFNTQLGLADTIGAAWAVAHYGIPQTVVPAGAQGKYIATLPPVALRIPEHMYQGLTKLGLTSIKQLTALPTQSLRKRFGDLLVQQLAYALGSIPEWLAPILPPGGYTNRFPCLHPIRGGREIHAILEHLLDHFEQQMKPKQLGARQFRFTIFRTDNKRQSIDVETQQPTAQSKYLLRLFEGRIKQLHPGQGVELFQLDTPAPEALPIQQQASWQLNQSQAGSALAPLLDRLLSRLNRQQIQRFQLNEKHWPERSFAAIPWLDKALETAPLIRPRPMCLLDPPELIGVSAPVPDYPPMLFRYAGEVHRIVRADGPERIEQEWWVQDGWHRDYYYVEDEQGQRYWIFRLGHYQENQRNNWFLHGFCP